MKNKRYLLSLSLALLLMPKLAKSYNVLVHVQMDKSRPSTTINRIFYRQFDGDNSTLLWMKSDGDHTFKITGNNDSVKEGFQFLTQKKGFNFTSCVTSAGATKVPLMNKDKTLKSITLVLENALFSCKMIPEYTLAKEHP